MLDPVEKSKVRADARREVEGCPAAGLRQSWVYDDELWWLWAIQAVEDSRP